MRRLAMPPLRVTIPLALAAYAVVVGSLVLAVPRLSPEPRAGVVALVVFPPALLLWFLAHRTLIRPLARVLALAEGCAVGEQATRTGIRGRDEVSRLGQAVDWILDTLTTQQARLRQSQESLDAIQAQARFGYWELPFGQEVGTWSREMYRLFQRDEALGPPTVEEFLNAVHLDDRLFIQPTRQGVLAVDNSDIPATFQRDFRSNPARGPVRYFSATVHCHRDASGKPAKFVGTVYDVTERRQTEEALRASEERFRQMAEHLVEVLWLFDVAKQAVLYVNPAYERVWGRACQGLYDNPSDWLEAIHPVDRRRALHAFEEKGLSGEYVEEFRIVRPDGTIRWVKDRAFPIREPGGAVERLVGIAEDVTEAKLIQEALAESQARTQAILDSAVDGIVSIDERGRVLTMNPSAERMFGYPAAEVVGQNVKILMPSPYREEHDDYIARYLATGKKKIIGLGREVTGRRKGGTTFPLDLAVAEARVGAWRIFVATLRDITERKRAEEMLRDYARRLEQNNRELQDFVSVASHDLQEPLRKILAFGDALLAEPHEGVSDTARDYLGRVLKSARRMETLIHDLLTLSRVTTRAQPFVPVDLGVVVQDVLSDLEARLQKSGGRVEVQDLPKLEADPTQMRQLLQNLIGNALKFHRPGHQPTVTVSGRLLPRAATRPGEAAEETCEIVVRDDGIGFDEKHLDRIFAPFQRLHGRNEYEGTGMGLTICRRIAERHGGTITARSAPNEGAAFIVTLPVRHRTGGTA